MILSDCPVSRLFWALQGFHNLNRLGQKSGKAVSLKILSWDLKISSAKAVATLAIHPLPEQSQPPITGTTLYNFYLNVYMQELNKR